MGNAAVSAVELYAQAPEQLAKVGEVIEIDVVLGPRTDWFEPESIQQFLSSNGRSHTKATAWDYV